MNFDYAVIGAGVSGIAAALIMARQGYRVTLLERASRTAPLLREFRRDGVRFSPGFHYSGGLVPGAVLDRCLRYLGVAGDLEPLPLDPEGYDHVRIIDPAFEFRFPAGWDPLRARLHRAFPGEERAVDRYLDAVIAAEQAFPYLNLDAPLGEISVLERMQGPTLQEFLDVITQDARLAAVLSAHCFLHGVPADEVPFTFHAHVVGSYYRSAHALRGGGESLARACDAALDRAGVAVRCGSAVSRIVLNTSGAVCGVELQGGGIVECGGVVATLHPALLPALLPRGALRPVYCRRLGALEDSLTAFIGYAVCERPVAGLGLTNLYLIPTPARLGFHRDLPLHKRPLYLSPAELSGGDGPYAGITVICPVPVSAPLSWSDLPLGVRTPAYRAVKEEATQGLRDHLERWCPELAGTIRSFEVATPLTIREVTGSPTGSLYGVKHRVGQYNPLPQTHVPGLTLAGQAVAAPGLLGAALSAFFACGKILGHDRLREELKRCV